MLSIEPSRFSVATTKFLSVQIYAESAKKIHGWKILFFLHHQNNLIGYMCTKNYNTTRSLISILFYPHFIDILYII